MAIEQKPTKDLDDAQREQLAGVINDMLAAGVNPDAITAFVEITLRDATPDSPAGIAAMAKIWGVTSEQVTRMREEYSKRGQVLRMSDVERFAKVRAEIRRA